MLSIAGCTNYSLYFITVLKFCTVNCVLKYTCKYFPK